MKRKKKRKNQKFSLKMFIKGFTLVELLAVIVILAIIMIIAIPSVLSTMEQAKQKTFIEYVQKVYKRTQEQYFEDLSFGNISKSSGENYFIYNITKDLKMSGTGGFKGMSIMWTHDNEYSLTVIVYDDTYMFGAIVDSTYPGATDIKVENLQKKSYYESFLGFEITEDTMNFNTVYGLYSLNKCREDDFVLYNMTDKTTTTIPKNITKSEKDACETTNDVYNNMKTKVGL